MNESLSTTIHSILVDDIASELKNAKLVILQFPRYFRAKHWYTEIANDVTTRLNQISPQPDPVVELANSTDAAPIEIILRILNASNDAPLNEAIEHIGLDRSPIFVCLTFNDEHPDEWCQVLESLSKAYANVTNPDIARPLLFFTFDVDLRARLRGHAGLRIIDFWNIYPSNDLRSLAHRILSATQKNPFEQLWRESAYTALANGDRHILEQVCTDRPNNLNDLFEFVLQNCHHPSDSSFVNNDLTVRDFQSTSVFVATEIGQVPTKLRREWEAGQIIGLTATGGTQHSWYYLATSLREEELRQYLDLLVWQEQVVGFFPLLIRLSSFAAQRISSLYGKEWSNLLPGTYQSAINTVEPSLILDTFDNHKHILGQLPRPLNNLLHSLRKLRNKLAHTDTIERRDVNELWEKYRLPRLDFFS